MSRSLLDAFTAYQSARTTFVQSIAEFSQRPANIDTLQQCSVLQLLRPLLLDPVPSIQQSAALALGRLASYNEYLAEQLVEQDIMAQLAYNLKEQNKFYKKIACYVIKCVAKHSPELATACIAAGVLDGLAICLTDFEPTVRENACHAITAIAQHTSELAYQCVDAGIVPSLILALQEPELVLKRASLNALAEIASKSMELAQLLIDSNLPALLGTLLAHADLKVKKALLNLCTNIAKHTVHSAEVVVEHIELSRVFLCIRDSDVNVRKAAVTLVRELTKHSSELCQLVVNSGGHVAMIQYIQEIVSSRGQSFAATATTNFGNTFGSTLNATQKVGSTADDKHIISLSYALPAIMSLGYISAYNELLATAVIVKNGVSVLKSMLDLSPSEVEDHIRCAIVWTLGQLGKHTSEHAEVLARADVLRVLVQIYHESNSSVDLHQKSYKSFKAIVSKTLYTPALEPLLNEAVNNNIEPKFIIAVVTQFAKILPNNAAARKSFVQSKGLQRIQELLVMYTGDNALQATSPTATDDGIDDVAARMTELVTVINQCFPVEVVQFYSPNYAESLLQKLDQQIAV